MNYNYLKYFRVLAQTEHYTHAASLLDISQPSLSHAISQLEMELGLYLFEKQGRNIKLTKYGRIYYNYVDKALEEIEKGTNYVQSLSSQDSGTIDLGHIYTLGAYFIPSVIKAFTTNHKNIKFTFYQSNSLDIIQKLKDESLDVGFCSFIKEEENNINFIPVAKEEMVIIVSKNHYLASYDEIDLNKLSNENWIFYSSYSGIRPYVDNIFKGLSYVPKITYEVEEDTSIFGLVDISYGIAIVPNIVTIKNFNIKVIKIKNKLDDRFIYMATRKNRYLPPSTTKFTSFLMHNSQEYQIAPK